MKILCYKKYVSYFLNYVGKDLQELSCQDVRDFLLAKKEEGLKSALWRHFPDEHADPCAGVQKPDRQVHHPVKAQS